MIVKSDEFPSAKVMLLATWKYMYLDGNSPLTSIYYEHWNLVISSKQCCTDTFNVEVLFRRQAKYES